MKSWASVIPMQMGKNCFPSKCSPKNAIIFSYQLQIEGAILETSEGAHSNGN